MIVSCVFVDTENEDEASRSIDVIRLTTADQQDMYVKQKKSSLEEHQLFRYYFLGTGESRCMLVNWCNLSRLRLVKL